ncbi:hypothetical protein GCM10010937_01940 [Gluconobacter japonicus]|uniref:Uncharacterized protein n=1 Tax=Gluconobacter japonicus TaxID=376620 RepID=A0ABQ5WEJ6_GLUJA|nr:hypothetical protein GCM10010937_01940 [Gluconobacter japonicus]
MIEPMQQDFEIRVVCDVDRQNLGCDATVEPLDHPVRLRGIRSGSPTIDILTGFLEGVCSEARASVGQDMRDPERKGEVVPSVRTVFGFE